MLNPLKKLQHEQDELKQLQIVARNIAEGIHFGLNQSKMKGFATDFSEHRSYTPGDDIKHLDWKHLAKSDRLFIKQYDEERSLDACVVMDASGSMRYGESGRTKLDFACSIATSLARLLFSQQDHLGLMVFNDHDNLWMPPGRQARQQNRLLEKLNNMRALGAASVGKSLSQLEKLLHKRTLILVFSDFFDDITILGKSLQILRHARHEVIVIQCIHPDEQKFDFKGGAHFIDLEDRRIELDCYTPELKDAYLAEFLAHQHQLSRLLKKYKIDLLSLDFESNISLQLRKFLEARLGRGK
ncbi:MAG: DUF58 domain-containing protein [Lentisphaeria bacterium]|nr:DUF58 domain-containing protein [Lentisphaeria bacterium]